MATIDVKVPDIGDFKDVPIIEILVKVGDMVKADDPLISLESDKATMEVPSPGAGKVAEILVKVGERVGEGKAIIRLESGEAKSAPAAAPAPAAAGPAAASPAAASPAAAPKAAVAEDKASPAPVSFDGVHASPGVRRLARELDIDLNKLKGSGEKGRITKEDVKASLGGGTAAAPVAVATGGSGIPEIPAVDFSKFGPIEIKPMARIKKLSGPHLHRSWLNIPHVTHQDEADITETDAYRKELDDVSKADKKKPYRVSLLPFLMKAAVNALKAFPDFNSSLAPTKDALIYKNYYHIGIAVDTPDGLVVPVIRDVDRKGIGEISRELGDLSAKADKKKPYRVSLLPFLMKAAVNALKAFPDFNSSLAPTKDALIYKNYYHIGIAVDTPDGLVVPVIRDVDRKGIGEISRELGDLSAKARDGKLSASDMQGASFTISSLGGIGGTFFTPIVNAPEVAILGVVRSKMAPVWDGKEFKPRLMLPLCLSYDHRVIDGASGARFSRHLATTVEDVRRLVL